MTPISRLATVLVAFVPAYHGAADTPAQYPGAQISNGLITAKLYLPDADHGSYRATRFDWSGIISSLTFEQHEFFGQWYPTHDPLVHDAITGPVDIFHNNSAGLGYAEARPGQTFLRIGVGRLEKPDEPAYRETHTYNIIDAGRRGVRKGRNWIEFTHRVSDPSGYAYAYTKTISLVPGKPKMILSHVLRNTGSKFIDTTVFNHGFFQIDAQTAGPDLVWTFPFEPATTRHLEGMAAIRGNKIVYLRELKPGERVLAPLQGFGSSAEDYGFTLENRKTGAGVRITGDRPIVKLNFWSRALAYSPEAYVHLSIPPGSEETWATKYVFYTSRDVR